MTPRIVARQVPLSMGILQARILEWIAIPSSRESSQPRSPALQVDSLPAEPPRKPKNTGVGSLSLLQWLFPTQESNQRMFINPPKVSSMWIFRSYNTVKKPVSSGESILFQEGYHSIEAM